MWISRTLIGFLALGCSVAVSADIGQIKTLSGEVYIIRGGEQVPGRPGLPLEQADTVLTGADGQVGITFVDNSRISAGPNSELALSRFRFNATTHEGEFTADIKQGTLSVVSGQIAKHSPDQMKVRTPSSLLAVRGTTFLVKVGN